MHRGGKRELDGDTEEKRPRWGGRTSNPVGAVDGPLWVRLPLSSAIALHRSGQAPRPIRCCPAWVRERDLAMRRFECVLCGFVYDEASGLPDDGIAPGTRWEDVPEDWTCPDCAATKADFTSLDG